MKKYKWILILANLLLLLVFFNHSVLRKEKILSEGKLILLELAPVDPRSLMQGDYMQLRYDIASDVKFDSIPKRGFCIVNLDQYGVATRVRFQKDNLPLSDNEYAIEYTAGNWNINIGAESFFFEEGQAHKYDSAKYGGLKIDKEGNSILVGLFDVQVQVIK